MKINNVAKLATLISLYQPNCYILQFFISISRHVCLESYFQIAACRFFSLVAEFNNTKICAVPNTLLVTFTLAYNPTRTATYYALKHHHHFYQNIIRIYDWFEHFHLTSFLCEFGLLGRFREHSHTICFSSKLHQSVC